MRKDYSDYVSPFSMRYASQEMRKIFSELYKVKLWRRIWVTLAEVQHQAGLISSAELNDLRKHQDNISIERIQEYEKETKHDVVAAIKEFAEKANIGGGKIHLGATSMDIVDNADAIKMQEALALVETRLKNILKEFSKKINEYADVSCMGYTHLQPAEPTTVGYRLAFYAQDLLLDFEFLHFVKKIFKAKGMKGAVGTRASYVDILDNEKLTAQELDQGVIGKLGLDEVLISSQVTPRKFDYLMLSLLASIASSLSKFAGDVRILQSPGIGEWAEPFGKSQVGSSAMPFKKNPVTCEKICSLARFVTQLPPVALENASLSYLERTLDDSANKRLIIAEGFLSVDEILINAEKVIQGLVISKQRIDFNVSQFGIFAATERMIIAAVKKGADRQEMHELMRMLSLRSWDEIQKGKTNPLLQLLKENATLKKYLSQEEIVKLSDISGHTGDAATRALALVRMIKKVI